MSGVGENLREIKNGAGGGCEKGAAGAVHIAVLFVRVLVDDVIVSVVGYVRRWGDGRDRGRNAGWLCIVEWRRSRSLRELVDAIATWTKRE